MTALGQQFVSELETGRNFLVNTIIVVVTLNLIEPY